MRGNRERGSDGVPSRWWPQSRRWPAQGHLQRSNRWQRTEIASNIYKPNAHLRYPSSRIPQRPTWPPRRKQEQERTQREWRPWLENDRQNQHNQGGIPAGPVNKTNHRQPVSRDAQNMKTQGLSFSVYVDGLSDRITLIKLKTIFGKAGRVKDVFIQFKRKFQRRFRYGFVRFQNDEEAWRAIRTLNGLRMDGNYLVVKRANLKQATTNSVSRKIWRPKKQQNQAIPVIKKESPKEESITREATRQPDVGQLRFSASDMDNLWYQRCARARTLEAKPVDVIQDELARIGMYNFRLIPLGAEEVLLEFESKEEMNETLAECSYFLEQKLSDLHPCTTLTFGVAQLVWIRLWQVPLGLWSDPFFTAIGNRLGRFVELDVATKQRHRADFARILVRMHHPLLHCFSMSVDMEGTTCVILVEKDDYAYDYGKMETMPSTPVKLYNSEDATDFGDDNDILIQEVHAPVFCSDKEFDTIVDVESGEEDEVFRSDKLEGLQSMVDVEENYPGTNLVLRFGEREAQLQVSHASPAAAAAYDRPFLHQKGVQQKNSNSIALNGAFNAGEEVLEQLQVLKETGYTVEEIEEWKRNTKSGANMISKKQIFPFVFKSPDFISNNSVTGFSFNSKDIPQKYSWPLYSTFWDPLQVQQLQRPCLPQGLHNKIDLLRLAPYLPAPFASAFNVKETDSQEHYIRTSPHQIIRHSSTGNASIPQRCDSQEPQSPPKDLELSLADFTTPTPHNSPTTNSSKKSSQRGRPKGSKNKPIALPIDYLEPVTGEDGVTTRAQRAWLLGQELGLKPRGSEALMLRGLEAQIRENHPHLN